MKKKSQKFEKLTLKNLWLAEAKLFPNDNQSMSRLLKIPKSGLGFGLKFLAQDAGANESDQAIMSIANYPYSFKVCHYVMIT